MHRLQFAVKSVRDLNAYIAICREEFERIECEDCNLWKTEY
jgi:uncharacterized small protein (DUF1192 family)